MIKKLMILCVFVAFFFSAGTSWAEDPLASAETYFSKGQFGKAARQAEKVLKKQPDNIKAGIILAESLSESGKFMRAIAVYKDLIRIYPDNMDLVFSIGIVYNKSEYHVNAADAYKQVIAKQPENLNAHHRLGVSYALCMDLNDAYSEYRFLKKRDEKLADDLLQYIQTNR